VKLSMLYVLIFPLVILSLTAWFVLWPPTACPQLSNPGPHGLTQILYAFTLAPATTVRPSPDLARTGGTTLMMGWDMLIGRFLMMIPVIALAGNLAQKERAAFARDLPGEYGPFHSAADWRDFAPRSSYVLPGAEPGTDS